MTDPNQTNSCLISVSSVERAFILLLGVLCPFYLPPATQSCTTGGPEVKGFPGGRDEEEEEDPERERENEKETRGQLKKGVA